MGTPFDFPASPTEGQVYTPAGGPSYVWRSPKWMLGANAGARNRIVNPSFAISQENVNTASGPAAALNYHPADQWWTLTTTSPGTLTVQRVQSVTPNGSPNRLRLTVGTAKAALAAGDYVQIVQQIEGNRTADLRFGTAFAHPVTLRFGWKSPAGTYSVGLTNSANNRNYLTNFTIAAGQANTDTEQVIVIPGDTTGTWLTDTGIGLSLRFYIASGSTFLGVAGWQVTHVHVTSANTNGMATAGAVYEVFDVGLYAGSGAPSWEPNTYDFDLAECQRYFWKWAPPQFHFNGYGAAGAAIAWFFKFPMTMKATPAMSSSFAGATFSNCTFPAGADLPSAEGFRIYASCTAAGNVSCVPAAANHVTANARLA